ncbi:hypothetical protein DFP72DRAFT_498538 [Ephemerocybe angulata]|uniref:Uncharacterized protein n=1 Tax=Ephemerocybe angulata TaxID=980116 RepID=A0A8H6HSJ0_9AGAR|nr:hypothetical protein DFP72DRAFT_498538 [Tulosesus angulatus]
MHIRNFALCSIATIATSHPLRPEPRIKHCTFSHIMNCIFILASDLLVKHAQRRAKYEVVGALTSTNSRTPSY